MSFQIIKTKDLHVCVVLMKRKAPTAVIRRERNFVSLQTHFWRQAFYLNCEWLYSTVQPRLRVQLCSYSNSNLPWKWQQNRMLLVTDVTDIIYQPISILAEVELTHDGQFVYIIKPSKDQ